MATELEGLLLGAGSTSFSSQAPSAMFHQHRAALGDPSQSPYAGRALEVPGKDKHTHKNKPAPAGFFFIISHPNKIFISRNKSLKKREKNVSIAFL